MKKKNGFLFIYECIVISAKLKYKKNSDISKDYQKKCDFIEDTFD
jgi:hypothetical protein